MFCGLGVALFASCVEWAHYRELAGWERMRMGLWDRAALMWLLCLKGVLVLAPFAVVGGLALWRGRTRAARWVVVLGWGACFGWLALDMGCQKLLGSHVLMYLPYLMDVVRNPQGAQWGGDVGGLVGMALGLLAATAAAGWFCWELAGRVVARVLVWRPGLASRRGVQLSVACLPLVLVGGGALVVLSERSTLMREVAERQPMRLGWYRHGLARAGRWVGLRRHRPTVRIVSVLANVRGDDAGKETVRLHNFGPEEVVVAGWHLVDGRGNRYRLRGALGAGKSRLVRLPAGSLDLRDDDEGDVVSLVDAQGRLRHEVSYRGDQAIGGTVINFRDEEDFDAFSRLMTRRARPVYRRYQQGWLRYRPPDTEARLPAVEGRRPDVVVIVLESLRREGLALMPRLEAWSRKGLRLRRHYSSSNTSHYGLYSLLYSRLPLFYDRDLDHRVRPQLCETLGHAGYQTRFLSSGQFHGWRRMHELFNTRNFDEAKAAYDGNWMGNAQSWIGHDRWLFRTVRERLAGADRPPQLVVAFAMASHYPYVFPDDCRKHTPCGVKVDYWNWMELDREQLHNRYKNAMVFLEQQVMETIEALDPARTVVIVTGDHGESLGEDGVLSHGSRPSEVQLGVPFVMVGPGVPARELTVATTHTDVVPTLLHALAGRRVPLARVRGRDLLAGEVEDQVLLNPRQMLPPLELLLIRGRERMMLKVGVEHPHLETYGLLDERGAMDLERAVPPDASEVERWVAALEAELSRGED